MTPPLEHLERVALAATAGPWDVWAERTETKEEAIAELTAQVNLTVDFCGAVYLLNANGKCPATTGCGPTSAANAEFIAAANPSTILSLIAEIRELREALEPFALEGLTFLHGNKVRATFNLADIEAARASLSPKGT